MRKLIIILLLIMIAAGGAFAQDAIDYEGMRDNLETVTQNIANALPMASTVGLQWSDAFIGKFPHLGVGVSVGFASIPLNTFGDLLSTFGVPGDPIGELTGEMDLPEEVSGMLDMVGFPFPAVTADARLGGFVLPFDIGIKGGFIPPQAYGLLDDATGGLITQDNLDYLLAGFDVRFALLHERTAKERKEGKNSFLTPDLIVGGGYTYFRGKLAVPMGDMSFGIDNIPIPIADALSNPMTYDPETDIYNYSINVPAPSVGLSWESHVIDLKAQVSKKILWLFTPYVGVGASYGRSRTKAGFFSDINVTKDGSPATIGELQDDLAAAEEAIDELSNSELKDYTDVGDIDVADIDIPLEGDGFTVSSWENGWGFRVYGGLSINIFVLKLDVSAMYNIIANSLGAQLGVRLQF